MLHTINKSPFEKDSLTTCLRYAEKGASVLFIEDAVYACTKGTKFENAIHSQQGDIKFYVLGPDLEARGLSQEDLSVDVEILPASDLKNLFNESEVFFNF